MSAPLCSNIDRTRITLCGVYLRVAAAHHPSDASRCPRMRATRALLSLVGMCVYAAILGLILGFSGCTLGLDVRVPTKRD
jgi:hypothetical protein